jgi:predicted nucleotidyltransferase
MIILKLIAWSDRPEERDNDLVDILRIIEHYFEYDYDEIVEQHNDTFDDQNFDQLKIGAEVLGRKARFYLNKSDQLSKRVVNLVESNIKENTASKIARRWAREL